MKPKLTIVLARARDDEEIRRQQEDTLRKRFSGRPGMELVITPHLYDLENGTPVGALLQSTPGDMAVFAWLPTRATYWVLRAMGVEGEPGAWPPSFAKKDQVSRRRIWCVDFRADDPSEAGLTKLEEFLNSLPDEAAESTASAPRVVEEPVRPRWYPVVDVDRCVHCLECLNFCLFGVYGVDENDRLLIEEPDACRPGCPACARVCPAGAILFPEHADPTIAGDAEAPAAMKLDLSQLMAGLDPAEVATAERDRARAEKRKETSSREGNLDRLVDELEDLEL